MTSDFWEEGDRSFKELSGVVYEKIAEADILEESDDGVIIDAEFDEKEAAFLRMEILNPANDIGDETNIDDAAQFAIHSRAKSIFDTVDQIDEVARSHVEDEKDELDFESLAPDEKEEWGKELSEGEQRIRNLLTSTELFDDVIVFYMLVGSLVERYTREIMQEELVAQELEGEKEAEEWIGNMSQAHREKILKLTGVFSQDFISEMGDIRETRNKLAHEIEHQQRLETLDDIAGEVAHTVSVLNRLHEELHEIHLIGLE